MTPTKLLIGRVLVVVAIVILGVWAATQWAAAMLGYQEALGAPWFTIRGMPAYQPWGALPLVVLLRGLRPDVFDKACLLAAASGFATCAAAIA